MRGPTPRPNIWAVTPEDYQIFEAGVGRPAETEDEVAFAKGTGVL